MEFELEDQKVINISSKLVSFLPRRFVNVCHWFSLVPLPAWSWTVWAATGVNFLTLDAALWFGCGVQEDLFLSFIADGTWSAVEIFSSQFLRFHVACRSGYFWLSYPVISRTQRWCTTSDPKSLRTVCTAITWLRTRSSQSVGCSHAGILRTEWSYCTSWATVGYGSLQIVGVGFWDCTVANLLNCTCSLLS